MTIHVNVQSSTSNGTATTVVHVNENAFIAAVDVIIFIQLLFSVLLLTAHIVILIASNHWTNIQGKMFIAYCACLLLEYVFALVTSFASECTLYVLYYYFTIMNSFWILTMSFDFWKAIRFSRIHMNLSYDRGVLKFVLYFLFNLTMPGLALYLFTVYIFQTFEINNYDMLCEAVQTEKFYDGQFVLQCVVMTYTALFAIHSSIPFCRLKSQTTKSKSNFVFFDFYKLYVKIFFVLLIDQILLSTQWALQTAINVDDKILRIITAMESVLIVVVITLRKSILQQNNNYYKDEDNAVEMNECMEDDGSYSE